MSPTSYRTAPPRDNRNIKLMEEEEGFEPPRGMTRLSVFKTDPFSQTWVFLQMIYKRMMVGKTGFEPATPWSQTKCSTKLSYFPLKLDHFRRVISGAPDRGRTYNLLIRSQMLYPVELRAHFLHALQSDFIILSNSHFNVKYFFWCGREESNFHGVYPH